MMNLEDMENKILNKVKRAINNHLLDEKDLESIDSIIQQAVNRECETESMYL